MDSEADRLTGEAPEIIRAVMKEMGVETVEGVLTEFGALIPGLKAKRFDVIAAGMYITPQRCEQIAFSNPTYTIGEAFIVEKGNPHSLHSFEDIAKHASATIGVMAGAVEHGYAKKTGIPDDRIVVFPDNVSGLDGVRAGRVDAFAATSLTIQDMLSKTNDEGVEQALPFTDPVIDGKSVQGYGAYGFRMEDAELRQAIDITLAAFIGSDEHLSLVQPFGFGEANVPNGATAAQLCGN
jgi:polar amino acid transport system substrate-binding protein